MKKNIFHIFVFQIIILLSYSYAFADSKSFIKEYTYQASEYDSKFTCRNLALEYVKRTLLEELGTYLQSETEVRNYRLAKEQIIVFTAGIVKTEIIDEKWDGNTLKYWLKARMEADIDNIQKSIDAFRKNKSQSKELYEAAKKTKSLLKEIDKLKKELRTAKSKNRESDVNSLTSSNDDPLGLKAKKEYHNIELIKEHPPNILNNDLKLKKYVDSVRNLSANNYVLGGKALEFSGNYKEASEAYSKVIELNPKDQSAYYQRAINLSNLGEKDQSYTDMRTAARMGYKKAQEYLRAKGIR